MRLGMCNEQWINVLIYLLIACYLRIKCLNIMRHQYSYWPIYMWRSLDIIRIIILHWFKHFQIKLGLDLTSWCCCSYFGQIETIWKILKICGRFRVYIFIFRIEISCRLNNYFELMWIVLLYPFSTRRL